MSQSLVIDCLGEFCPMPIIKLAKAAKTAAPGDTIEVLSDDEAAKVDIPVWCRMKRHEFLGRTTLDKGWSFTIRIQE